MLKQFIKRLSSYKIYSSQKLYLTITGRLNPEPLPLNMARLLYKFKATQATTRSHYTYTTEIPRHQAQKTL